MKFVKSNLAKKLIIILVAIMLFSTIAPTRVSAAAINILVNPVTGLISRFISAIDMLMGGILLGEDLGTVLDNIGDVKRGNDIEDWRGLKTLIGPDTIFANKVELFNVNIFEAENPTDPEVDQYKAKKLRYDLSKGIAEVYIVIRNICATVMLAGLIYTGIQILINSNIPTKKMRYLESIQDWVIGMFILILTHIIMIMILDFAQILTDAFQGSLLPGANINQYLMSEIFQWGGLFGGNYSAGRAIVCTIMLGVMTWLLILFTFSYAKRLFWVCILIVIAPVCAVLYAFGNQTKQIYTNWLKEFTMFVFVQPYHMIVYYVLIMIPLGTFSVAAEDNMSLIEMGYCMLAMWMMKPAEEYLRELFNMQKMGGLFSADNGAKTAAAAWGTAKAAAHVPLAAVGSAIGVAKGGVRLAKGAYNLVSGGMDKLSDLADARQAKRIEKRGYENPEQYINDKMKENKQLLERAKNTNDPIMKKALTLAGTRPGKEYASDYHLKNAGFTKKEIDAFRDRRIVRAKTLKGMDAEGALNSNFAFTGVRTAKRTTHKTFKPANTESAESLKEGLGTRLAAAKDKIKEAAANVASANVNKNELNGGNITITGANVNIQGQSLGNMKNESAAARAENNYNIKEVVEKMGKVMVNDGEDRNKKILEGEITIGKNKAKDEDGYKPVLTNSFKKASRSGVFADLYENSNKLRDAMSMTTPTGSWKSNVEGMRRTVNARNEKLQGKFINNEGNKQYIIKADNLMEKFRAQYPNKPEAYHMALAEDEAKRRLESMAKVYIPLGIDDVKTAHALKKDQKQYGYSPIAAIKHANGFAKFNSSPLNITAINTAHSDINVKVKSVQEAIPNAKEYYNNGIRDINKMIDIDRVSTELQNKLGDRLSNQMRQDISYAIAQKGSVSYNGNDANVRKIFDEINDKLKQTKKESKK